MRGGCLALVALVVLVILGGCSDDAARGPADPPRLGGVLPTATPPSDEMDELEQPIARRLDNQVAAQGLHVDHLACPPWDGKVPADLTCDGWFDGVKGTVSVSLTRDKGGMVAFDAELRQGVIATKKLVDELLSRGYTHVDCGSAPAYPTDIGSTITCAVTRQRIEKFVVATITDDHGGVTISDF
jgi:hypothetical protein